LIFFKILNILRMLNIGCADVKYRHVRY